VIAQQTPERPPPTTTRSPERFVVGRVRVATDEDDTCNAMKKFFLERFDASWRNPTRGTLFTLPTIVWK
jgi:hypothetical protein